MSVDVGRKESSSGCSYYDRMIARVVHRVDVVTECLSVPVKKIGVSKEINRNSFLRTNSSDVDSTISTFPLNLIL